MGIVLSDPESGGRSKLASAAFTAIGLAFFFGVGLAGGAAYKIYFSADGGPQIAAQTSPPPAAPATPEQAFASATPNPAESTAEKTAPPDSAPVEASAAPTPEPQATPTLGEASEPAMTAQAAPSPAAPEPAPQAASAQSQATPEAPIAPAQPAAEAAMQTAEPSPAAAIPPKPAMAAKAHRAPQIAALHPPTAQVGVAGHFRVQFGAFANEENARRVQAAVEAAGLKVAVSPEAGASGNPLFIVRSPSYPDRAAAVSAAQNVQNRAKHLANPIAIDYAIIPDRAAGEQHAQR